MKRSAGVTAAAIVLLIASGVGSLFAAIGVGIGLTSSSLFAAGWKSYSSAMVLVVWSLWWVITGIGILRLRCWARVSVLTLSAVVLFFQARNIAIALLMPLTHSPHLTTFYVSLFTNAVIPSICSIWWIVYFSRFSVGQQFSPATERPVSISVIGAFLVASASLAGILSFTEYMTYRNVAFKIFGWIAIGAYAWICFGLWVVLSLVVGSGLLLGKRWANRAAMVCILIYVLFGLSTIRSGQVAHEFLMSNGSWNYARHGIGRLALFDTAWDLSFGAVALYFLWSRRGAFAKPQIPAQTPASTEGSKT